MLDAHNPLGEGDLLRGGLASGDRLQLRLRLETGAQGQPVLLNLLG